MTDDVDVRARAAVDALDRELDERFDVPAGIERVVAASTSGGRPSWRWLPAAAAAVLVAVVLGATLAAGRGEQRSTAGEVDASRPGLAGVVVDDPAAVGVEVFGAAWGTGAVADVAPRHVHARISSDDAWIDPVVGSVDDVADDWFVGEVVDIGGPDAVATEAFGVPRVQWRDGARTLSLTSGRVGLDALIEIARDAVSAGWDGTEPLPGHRIVHPSTGHQLSPVFEPQLSSPTTMLAGYRAAGDETFVIASSPGSPAALEAQMVLAARVDGIDVGGTAGLLATFPQGAEQVQVVSWLTDDGGTMVRIATVGDAAALVERLEDHLTHLDRDAADRFVAAHPAPPDRPWMDRPLDRGADELTDQLMDDLAAFPPADRRVLAATELTVPGFTLRASVIELARGAALTVSGVDHPLGGGGGAVYELPSTDVAFLRRGGGTTQTDDGPLRGTHRHVVGTAPAGAVVLGVRDATSGEPIDVLAHDVQPVRGARTTLIAIVLPPDLDFPALLVDMRLPDGSTVTHRA